MSFRALFVLLAAAAACGLRRPFDDAAEPLRHLRRRRRCSRTAPRRNPCPRASSRKATSNGPSRPQSHRRRCGAARARPGALRHLLLAVPRLVGDGDGMVVQRGFPTPPSYHIARLRAAPARNTSSMSSPTDTA